MGFDFINKVRQHGLNVVEKFGVVSVILTGGIVLVNYMFGLHLSQYLERIPLIGQLVNIDLIEEFEDIQDGDLFYEELKSQLASLDINPGNIRSVKVRKDNSGQETFKVTTMDGKEQEIIVKKEADTYITLKPVYVFYYRDGNILKKEKEDKKELVYVELENNHVVCTGGVLTSDISATGSLNHISECVPCECETCPVCDAGDSTLQAVSDRYDEGYQNGYDKGEASCPQVNTADDSLSQIEQAAALCQKRVDVEYQKGLDEGYKNGYKVGDSDGYTRGYRDGQQFTSDSIYQDGYDAGYSDGYDSCYVTSGP